MTLLLELTNMALAIDASFKHVVGVCDGTVTDLTPFVRLENE